MNGRTRRISSSTSATACSSRTGKHSNADAVKYKLTRDLTAKGSMRRGEVNSIDSIDVIDPLTVQLNLKAPAAQLLAQLTDRAGIMISPKATEATGDKFGLHPVCAGPFSFDSRVAQDRIVLKRFPGYWDAKSIHFDEVVYLPNPNSSVRLANLQAGALDIVEYILPTDVPAVQKDPKLKTAIDDSLAYTGITVNTGNGPAQDTTIGKNALVRQAFELGVDRAGADPGRLFEHVSRRRSRPIRRARHSSSRTWNSGTRPGEGEGAAASRPACRLPVSVTLTITNRSDIQQTGEVIQSMESEAGLRCEDQDDGVRLVVAGGVTPAIFRPI